jgi:fibrillarin-like rRNA methylase
MRYKITIRRKNGVLLVKETNDKRILTDYQKTAEMYGDRVVRIEEKESNFGQWRPLVDLAVTGATIGVGLGLLGAVGNAFKK